MNSLAHMDDDTSDEEADAAMDALLAYVTNGMKLKGTPREVMKGLRKEMLSDIMGEARKGPIQ